MEKKVTSAKTLVEEQGNFLKRVLARIKAYEREQIPTVKNKPVSPNNIRSAILEFKLNVARHSTELGKDYLASTGKKSLAQLWSEKQKNKQKEEAISL